MKISIKPTLLKYLVLSAGGIGLVLRSLLYALATDEKGLLSRSHPLSIVLTALTLVVLAGIFLLCRPITGPKRFYDCFHTSIPGGIGCLVAAAGIALSTISEMTGPTDSVGLLVRILGFISAAAMLVAALSRLMGSKAPFLFYVAVCLYFCLRMVDQYRSWSSIPQLQDYCFQMLSCVSLMLTAYHHAAFHVDMGRHRSLWFFSLTSVFLCSLSLASPENQLFYLGTGIWAFTNLSNLTARHRRQRPTLHTEEEHGAKEV